MFATSTSNLTLLASCPRDCDYTQTSGDACRTAPRILQGIRAEAARWWVGTAAGVSVTMSLLLLLRTRLCLLLRRLREWTGERSTARDCRRDGRGQNLEPQLEAVVDSDVAPSGVAAAKATLVSNVADHLAIRVG